MIPSEPPRPFTVDDLSQHLDLLEVATQADMDELLHDLLVLAWPVKRAQDC